MGPAGFFSCVGCPWVERWTGTTLSHQHTAQRTSHTSPHQACLVGPGPPWPKYRTRLLGRWSCTFANSRAWEPAQLWSCLCCYSTQSTWLPRVSTPTRLYASGKGHPIQHSHGIHRVRWGQDSWMAPSFFEPLVDPAIQRWCLRDWFNAWLREVSEKPLEEWCDQPTATAKVKYGKHGALGLQRPV